MRFLAPFVITGNDILLLISTIMLTFHDKSVA